MAVWLTILLLGLVEGLTEFIPVSSTGHLIVAGHVLGFEGEVAKTFDIFIQLGAILAVVCLYKKTFLGLFTGYRTRGVVGLHGLLLLTLTTLPALMVGAMTHDAIKRDLFNTHMVAVGLGVGGIALLLVELVLPRARRSGLGTLHWRDALIVGLFQCLALWPGTSRSAATIIGGMMAGIERKTAAEYSFLAAVPILCAAVVFDLVKSRGIVHTADMPAFALGFVVSLMAAAVAIKGFLRLLGSHTLRMFGWYRIIIAPCIWFFLG
jgi:undecaprenyl-diphosphatase